MPQAPFRSEPKDVEGLPEHDAGPFWTMARHRRLAWALLAALTVVLLAVIPPLVSINRYQRYVATSISGSLGRSVHFDSLSLHLLPLPAITIQNFVVNESPEFGAEPVMRAQTVEARLRVGSLWRRRIEVSHISLDSPSINLVRRRSDGAWNLQAILMQASQINAAPTAQPRAGAAPRFPYMEATDARINIKSDNDKLPFALKETDLALWLPQPDQWHLRLSGKPVRTDTDVSDVGLLRVDATLGRATDLAAAPIELNASWKPTPLGETAKLTAGYDLGWRGTASAEATLKGTLGRARLTSGLHLLAVRRADFVPEHTAEVNAHCEATTGGLLRSLTDLRCAIPTDTDTSMFAAIQSLSQLPAASGGSDMPDGTVKPGVLLIRGQIPDVLNASHSDLNISLQDASPNYALAWLRLFSRRIPRNLSLGGTFSLTASRSLLSLSDSGWNLSLTCTCDLPPSVSTGAVQADAAPATPMHWLIYVDHTSTLAEPAENTLAITAYPWPATLPFPKRTSSMLPVIDMPVISGTGAITGHISRSGYTLVYGSREAALSAASELPPLGDSLPAQDGTAGTLQSQRDWGGNQTWATAAVQVANRRRIRHAR